MKYRKVGLDFLQHLGHLSGHRYLSVIQFYHDQVSKNILIVFIGQS